MGGWVGGGEKAAVGESPPGKQSLGFFKAALCQADRRPDHTGLSLFNSVHFINGYH